MDRKITRREFVDGVAVTIGGVALAGSGVGGLAAALAGCGADSSAALRTPSLVDYPPALTDMRGQTNAARAVPHMLKDGVFWDAAGGPESTGESYDVVIVGAGLSGLSAAYVYSQKSPEARILILDNHDDFGGHARRNEYTPADGGIGRRIIGYGGTETIAAPSAYSPQALAVLEGIGVRPERFRRYFDGSFWADLGTMWFFDKETWGRDYAVVDRGDVSVAALVKDAPMAAQAKRDLAMIYNTPKDWLAGLPDEAKKQRLSEMTYAQYLADVVRTHPDVLKFVHNMGRADWGYGADTVGAIDAWAEEYPGFGGLGLSWAKPYRANSPSERVMWDSTDPYIHHFPDGCAGVARLLVRALIPEALPGRTMEDQVLEHLDYARLDQTGTRVRIRLGSPVVRVRHDGDVDSAAEVEVAYVQAGRIKSVKAKGAVMACGASMAPYIVDGLPSLQKQAAQFMTRMPQVSVNVLLRQRRAFEKLRISDVRAFNPDSPWVGYWLDYPVSMGGYEYPTDLSDAGLVHIYGMFCKRGMSPREGSRVGRQELMKTPYRDLERSIRDLFARTLGEGGFDPARDIEAITVNRWAHGYSIEYVSPWDNAFYPDGPLPGEAASTPFGRITFAGIDRSSRSYMDEAIDAAISAVNELMDRT